MADQDKLDLGDIVNEYIAGEKGWGPGDHAVSKESFGKQGELFKISFLATDVEVDERLILVVDRLMVHIFEVDHIPLEDSNRNVVSDLVGSFIRSHKRWLALDFRVEYRRWQEGELVVDVVYLEDEKGLGLGPGNSFQLLVDDKFHRITKVLTFQ